MKTVIQKAGTLGLAAVMGMMSLSASATVTLDNVTDYYLYETLVQSEFELENRLVSEIDAASEDNLTSQSMLLAVENSEEFESDSLTAE